MALAAGARLGRYEIQSAIGAGGMGEVYRARDTRLNRIVAIKILSEQLATDPQFRERFDREARTISQLDHPHICALYDVGEHDGTSFLVMQYLEGETLAERIAAKGALPITEALTIAIQIAGALDKAHHAGITHRDLKPGNIMLTQVGAKLLDFGLAKTGASSVAGAGRSMLPATPPGLAVPGAADTHPHPVTILEPKTPPGLTVPGAILGTFQYMAPEQLEGQEADARTDIFAFGAVFYEMLTGSKAFEGRTQASLIAAILDREPPPITASQPLTLPALDRLVRICLAKNPDDRWQTARDLTRELQWIAEGGTRATAPIAAPQRRRWAYAAWAVATVAVLTAIAVAAFALRRPAAELPLLRLDVNTPPTSDPTSFALSLDGRLLVFVGSADSGSKLWLRPLDETDARPLAGTEGASYPFWSPDQRAIGFFADGKLKRIDLAGGVLHVLAEAPTGRGGTWNSNGIILFAPNTAGGLVRVPATGGTPTTVTPAPGSGLSHRFPEFLPDGRQFLFSVEELIRSNVQVQGVYLGALDTPDTRRLLDADIGAVYAPPGYLLLVRQGTLMAAPFDAARGALSGEPVPVAEAVGSANGRGAFSVSSTGMIALRAGGEKLFSGQLVWFDRRGTALGTVGTSNQITLYPELAPDGQHVAIVRFGQQNFDVWLIDTSRGVSSRFTSDPAIDNFPLWAPDGSRLIFNSNRNGTFDLFEKPASGAREEQRVLTSSENKFPVDWSRDGRFILYVKQDAKTGNDLWALPLDGARKPFAVVETPFSETEGQFSPDGRWMSYRSNESGRQQVYLRPFPGPGGTWQVSTGGGDQPRWGPNGTELFYIASDGKLMAVSIDASSGRQTPEIRAAVPLFPTRTAATSGPPSRQQYAVARDGQRFLMSVTTEASTSPITILQNWTSALKK